ncbi:hypothetical protein K488DRAFT_49368 [Vararia minispora EC-137]|uniref:Uncharacterized protein n=1 Tax=Vararia minispora EC-137 TaxID=1314806 RepID=A0ACB8QLR9_9AGAM|nr:hypothetical protein K488DRAFT_49368 [Vararia minispora EC-137]
MVNQIEKRLLWHPRGENKFIVGGGTQLTLYGWSPEDPSIVQLASQHDLSLMKCFAWSPDPSLDDLVAIGLSSGRVDLLRLESTRSGRGHVTARGPQVPLNPKINRACTTLAFCNASPQYLAVGLDKVRNDASLVIWDIQSCTPSLVVSSTGSSSSHITAPPPSPARAFFPLSASRLMPSGHVPLPRSDTLGRSDSRILQSYAAAEIVNALTWLPQSTNVLAAGLSQRFLRLFDLRNPNTPAVQHHAGRIQAFAIDPNDPHLLAAIVDSTVTVWDHRKLPTPLLTFTPRDAAADIGSGANTPGRVPPSPNYTWGAISALEFSPVRRGVLATLERDAATVRLWDLISTDASPVTDVGGREGSLSRDAGRTQKISWSNPTSILPWTAQTSQCSGGESPSPALSTLPYALILADTRRSKRFRGPLSSFTIVPSAREHPLSCDVLGVTRDGDLEVVNIHHTPMHAEWSSRGTLAIAVGTSYCLFSGVPQSEVPPEHPWSTVPPPEISKVSSVDRGRTANRHTLATFGRGDEDGFPALTSPLVRLKAIDVDATTLVVRSPHPQANLPLPEEFDQPPPSKETSHSRARSSGRTGTSRSRRAVERVQGVVDEDFSMVARRRVLAGYGLGNLAHNATLFANEKDADNENLCAVWTWMDQTRKLLAVPLVRSNGFDFSNQGLLGIWESFPSSSAALTSPPSLSSPAHRPMALEESTGLGLARPRSKRGRHRSEISTEFNAALLALGAYHGLTIGSEPGWKPGVRTGRLLQRRFALELCGWSVKEEEFDAVVTRRWEKDGKRSRAACWLVFTRKHNRAIDLLMRSPEESHKIMAGTLAALVPATMNGPLSPELQQHYDRLILRLEDTYFAVMLRHLALGDWGEVLDEEALPLRERLAIALQFLEDDALTRYLRRLSDSAVARGNLDGIMVTGLTSTGLDLLQSYVDRCGDLQTASILGALVHPYKIRDARVERWIDAYRDLLDGWKLFYHRCQFDIQRGQLLQAAVETGKPIVELAPKQVLIRCNYCNKSISMPQTSGLIIKGTACPHCGRPLPRCSVCLMYLTILPDSLRNSQIAHHNAILKDTIDDAIVFCQTCRHGGHASHILEWFYGGDDGALSHAICAVADCTHRCAEEM